MGDEDDFCAEGAHHLGAFAGVADAHDGVEGMAEGAADDGEARAGVAAGDFDDGLAGGEFSGLFGVADHGEGDAIFYATAGVD